jgi:hypothetical protein
MTMSEEIKNPIIAEMDNILASEDYEIEDSETGEMKIWLSKSEFTKFRNEVLAKTNYVNTLIDRLQESTKESNLMAENNNNLIKGIQRLEAAGLHQYKLIQIEGKKFNDMLDKLLELVKDNPELKSVIESHPRFEVDEAALEDNNVEVVYE